MRLPLFSLQRLLKRPETLCHGFRRCQLQGLATLLLVRSFRLLGSLFQLPTLLSFYPSELFSSRVIDGRFPFRLSALAFPHETLAGFAPTLQRFHPTRKAVPLICNPTFYVGSGTHALLGLITFQALPPKTLSAKHLPSRDNPLAL